MTWPRHPSANDPSGTAHADAAFATWRAFDNSLSPIIGPRGFAALYQRSLQHARRAHPWLPAAQDGAPQAEAYRALHAALAGQDAEPCAAAHQALQEALHGLLAGMIGDSLTRHLLGSAGPDALPNPPPQAPPP